MLLLTARHSIVLCSKLTQLVFFKVDLQCKQLPQVGLFSDRSYSVIATYGQGAEHAGIKAP